jgi:hypothetical protein
MLLVGPTVVDFHLLLEVDDARQLVRFMSLSFDQIQP